MNRARLLLRTNNGIFHLEHLSGRWPSYDSPDTDEEGFHLDNWRGSWSFKEGMRWPDDLAGFAAEWPPYAAAIRPSLIERKAWAGGNWHPSGTNGVPGVGGGHFRGCG